MQPEWKKVEVLSKFEPLNLQERYFWGGLGVDGKTILEWTLKSGELGLNRLRIGVIGDPLLMRY